MAGLAHERTIGSKGKGLWGIPHAQLPAKIQHVYNDLVEGGKPPGSHTYRLAVGIVQNWAQGHDGKGNKVSAKVQAEAAAAVAEWEKLRARAHARGGRTRLKEARAGMGKCPHCGKPVPVAALDKKGAKCPHCGKAYGTALSEATLTAKKRGELADSDFALPGRRYPIHDLRHARNALARVAQHGTPEERKKVRAAVAKRYPRLAEAGHDSRLADDPSLLGWWSGAGRPRPDPEPAAPRVARASHARASRGS